MVDFHLAAEKALNGDLAPGIDTAPVVRLVRIEFLPQAQAHAVFEELEADASEDELAAERAAARTTTVKSFTRKRPSRRPFPDYLPRERVVIPAPEVCACCGSNRLAKLGEDVTETLEVIPRRWDSERA